MIVASGDSIHECLVVSIPRTRARRELDRHSGDA
jgi:hypothetical protein